MEQNLPLTLNNFLLIIPPLTQMFYMLTYGNKAIGILDPKPCISGKEVKLKTTDLFFYGDFKERL